ncbi:hypothetical protein GCM10028818_54810 [Spirosoma horti]
MAPGLDAFIHIKRPWLVVGQIRLTLKKLELSGGCIHGFGDFITFQLVYQPDIYKEKVDLGFALAIFYYPEPIAVTWHRS